MTKSFNYAKCIKPLLETLDWQGAIRRIYEAIPDLKNNLTIFDLRNMMGNLGYVSTHKALTGSNSSEIFYPCLFVTQREIYILLKREEKMIHAINCRTQKKITLSEETSLKGTAYTFSPQPECVSHKGWLDRILGRFQTFFYKLISIGFLTSLLNTSVFLFVMTIFDTIIPARSDITLGYMILGLGLILGCTQVIQVIQNRSISHLNTRLDMLIGTEAMQQMLNLPLSLGEELSMSTQASRLREWDKTRQKVIEPLTHFLLKGPSIIIFIIALGWVGGLLALVPLGILLIFGGLMVLLSPILRHTAHHLSTTSFERNRLLLESMDHLAIVKHLDIKKSWVDRFHRVSTSATMAQKRADLLSSFIINLSQTVIKILSLVVIMWGASRVMEGTMTIGGFIAVILLVWQSLPPLQYAFMMLGRLDQMVGFFKEINRFMSITADRHLPLIALPSFEGAICVQNVGFRYPNAVNFTLQGIMMEVKPGEIIAIVGANGSGKTTLLKLLLGSYIPQAGSITFDGVDSQQFSSLILRQSIAYAPQKIQFFEGTIAQNFRLVEPDATDKEIMEAAEKAGVADQIMALPEGLQTCIGNQSVHPFSFGFLQRLNLARAYVRKSKIIIMDEPGNALDPKGEELLHHAIQGFRHHKTTLLVTHRPNLIALADRILFLQNGTMQTFGYKECMEIFTKEAT